MCTGVSPKRIATRSFMSVTLLPYPLASLGTVGVRQQTFHWLCHSSHPWWLNRKTTFTFSSLERRWSSRTFRYGYLVTTSLQSSAPPSTAGSLRLPHRLRVFLTLIVWRAVCTRPGNVFTVACWSTITSNSDFVQASCSLQSELGRCFWVLLHLAVLLLFV